MQSKIWHQREATQVLIAKKQQRLKTVHVGALAKIVVCLVVNIFLLGPGEEIWEIWIVEGKISQGEVNRRFGTYQMMSLPVRLTHIKTLRRTVAKGKRCYKSIVSHHHRDLWMTENSWKSGVARVRRTRQYGGRVPRTEAMREGMRRRKKRRDRGRAHMWKSLLRLKL